jgi:hypothetical protein
MNKVFSELAVGERFQLNGINYVKIQEVRVSCCRSINAQDANNPASKTFIQASTTVTINA